MSAYDNDPRVTAIDGAGFEVAIPMPSGRQMVGRVQPDGDRWKSFWADGDPLPHWHDTADEGIDSFIGGDGQRRVTS